LEALDRGSNPLTVVIGFWENVIGQTMALSKTPFDFLRGSGGEEKVLKNAKDACASEALEIATYTAIERLARSIGDEETANRFLRRTARFVLNARALRNQFIQQLRCAIARLG